MRMKTLKVSHKVGLLGCVGIYVGGGWRDLFLNNQKEGNAMYDKTILFKWW